MLMMESSIVGSAPRSRSNTVTSAATPTTPLLQPEREPLQFTINTEGLPADSTALLQHIQQVAESVLYHWKTFPIVLPPPLAVQWDPADYGTASEERPCRPLVLRDAFIPPSFDELDAVAADSKGDPRKLDQGNLDSIRDTGCKVICESVGTSKVGVVSRGVRKRRPLTLQQLQQIRDTGQFSVSSLHFPQQQHVWQVSPWLQKGREHTLSTLLDDVAAAAALIAVVAKRRITGPCFSLRHALSSVGRALVIIVDVFLGVPWLSAEHLEARLQEERCTHLVQELAAKDGDISAVCGWLEEQIRKASVEKAPLTGARPPSLPYVFSTPQGHELDLRLFNREVMRAAVPVLVSILEKEARGWFLHFREKTIADLRAQGLTDAQVEKGSCSAVQEEYLRRVGNAVSSHPALQQLAGPGTADLLCRHAQAVTLMHRAVSEVEDIYSSSCVEFERALRESHPILSRVRRWRQHRIRQRQKQLQDEYKWRPHQQALSACREAGLHQHAYFLHRDLAFMKERAPVLQKELQSLKQPTREFEWRSQVMFPERYVVQRNFRGRSETIPTVLSSVPTSITATRTPHQPGYVLHKQVVRLTSTRWPLWRVFNLCHRSWAWTCNAVFLFGLWIPLCSPISLRALFCSQPFMPDYELSQVNGAVCPSRASLTLTLAHRLHHLWRRIAKARTHFETTPDTGFIGKGVSRHLNRLYNYVVKGALGTLFYVLIFPIVCLIVSVASFVVALFAPVWVPCVVVAGSILSPLVYDFDAPEPDRRWAPLPRALLIHLLLGGLVQPLLVALVVLVICPLLAALVLMLGVVRYSVRSFWDWLVFEAVIRKRGRVPAADSCLVKRVAGPGLHHLYCYQISGEQALAALEARLEQELLQAHQTRLEELIAQPLNNYNEFLRTLFGPFSGGGTECGGGHERVSREVRELRRSLIDKLETRRRELQLGLPSDIRMRLKLTTRELRTSLKHATVLLEQFFPTRLFPMIVVPSSQQRQPSSEQQSRIDSGISTAGGDLDEERGSFIGADPAASSSRELLRAAANVTTTRSVIGSLSLTGHGKNLAGGSQHNAPRAGQVAGVSPSADGGANSTALNGPVAGQSAAAGGAGGIIAGGENGGQRLFQSQNLLTRGRSQDSGNFGGRNASEGTGLDGVARPNTRGALLRDVSSFDCERGLKADDTAAGSTSSCRLHGHSEDRLIDESREILLLGVGEGSGESREVLLEPTSSGGGGDQLSLANTGVLRSASPPKEVELRVTDVKDRETTDGQGVISVTGVETAAGDSRTGVTVKENRFTSEEAWWDSRGLQPGDYSSLAAILFTEIFSPEFLTPMDDEDTAFQIEMSGVNLSRYSHMLRHSPPRPDLDPLLTVHAPRGNTIHVPPPYLDITCFTPMVRHATPTDQRPAHSRLGAASKAAMWGTTIAQRLSLRARPNTAPHRRKSPSCGSYESPLLIPPPIPHPAVVAVIIYNREASDPIQLSSPDTQHVLRFMEDYVENIRQRRRGSDEHWLGGGPSFDTSETPDSTPPSSPPSLYRGHTYTVANETGADSRTATLPLSAALGTVSPALYDRSVALELNTSPGGSPSTPPDSASSSQRGVLDSNPLRSLLESHPPFSVSLDLAPPEDPPENDYEDTLRTRHANDTLESYSNRTADFPTAV